MGYITLLDVAFAGLGLFILTRFFSRKIPAPLPPGPKRLPLIGNALDMPTKQEWKTFSAWGEIFGDIVSITVLGKTIVILNSTKIAIEMLDRKSSIYSDRPKLMMGGELVGWKKTLALTPYSNRFRAIRRMFHAIIGTKSIVAQYMPVEERETKRFLKRVLKKPEAVAEHIRWTAGSIIMKIAYGYDVQEQDDPIVDLVDKATEQFALSTAPGAFLVDIFPVLQYVPAWFPGVGWKKTAASWAKTLSDMAAVPLEFTRRQMAEGLAPSSFTSNLLEHSDKSAEEEFRIKWAAASLYSGGADTTVSAIYTFFLAMTLNPSAARRAQEEIDTVIGPDRLPNFGDRESLPYVEALVKEVLRWGPVTPLGLPHCVTEDDIHRGYHIPKGTIVIANVWHLLHDPLTYSEPLAFSPERFLKMEPEQDPREICFGFGRRTCPGMNLADASVWISCAYSLSVFDITRAKDETGREIVPDYEYTNGTISHPKPFPCVIKPRNEKAEALIRSQD